MGKSIWQKMYDAIDSYRSPAWLKVILAQVQKVLIEIALGIGKEYIKALETKIIDTAGLNVTSEEKFRIVFHWAKANIHIKDSVANALIELLVLLLKQKGFSRVT